MPVLDIPKEGLDRVDSTESFRGSENSYLSIVENPVVEGNLGILLSKRFEEDQDGNPEFSNVLHLRIDGNDLVREADRYQNATIHIANRLVYNGDRFCRYRYIRTNGNIIPAPSLMGYLIASINFSDYERFLNIFSDQESMEKRLLCKITGMPYKNDIEIDAVREINDKLLENFGDGFKVDENRKLILPNIYASLPIKRKDQSKPKLYTKFN